MSVHERPVGDNQRPRVCVQAEEALAAAETRMNNCVKGIIFYEIGRREYVAVIVSLPVDVPRHPARVRAGVGVVAHAVPSVCVQRRSPHLTEEQHRPVRGAGCGVC